MYLIIMIIKTIVMVIILTVNHTTQIFNIIVIIDIILV